MRGAKKKKAEKCCVYFVSYCHKCHISSSNCVAVWCFPFKTLISNAHKQTSNMHAILDPQSFVALVLNGACAVNISFIHYLPTYLLIYLLTHLLTHSLT